MDADERRWEKMKKGERVRREGHFCISKLFAHFAFFAVSNEFVFFCVESWLKYLFRAFSARFVFLVFPRALPWAGIIQPFRPGLEWKSPAR